MMIDWLRVSKIIQRRHDYTRKNHSTTSFSLHSKKEHVRLESGLGLGFVSIFSFAFDIPFNIFLLPQR